VCEVSIPLRTHKPGSLESPFLGLEYLADERQHILLKKVTPMDRATFFRNLSDKLQPDEENEDLRRDAMVFVPGFNASFREVARRTAQISYDLGFTGAPIMFSWPSDGSFLSYLSDREDIEWSVPHIERFLTELLEEARPGRLHLIAHSMGNEGLLRALTLIALRMGADAPPIFENVILAAPDFDAQIFVEQTAPQVRGLSKRWTVYVSDKDGALNVSSRIRNAKRLGLPVTLAAGVDTVDATGIEVTPWSVPEFHSYYATKRLVIADLIGVLEGLDPASRELFALMQGGLQYWSFARPSP
jgi:esterase/lipase superfamily enzyme